MPFDPGYVSGKDDECMRLSVAWHLDKHARRVRFIPPNGGTAFWQRWYDYLLEYHDTRMTLWIPEGVAGAPGPTDTFEVQRVGRRELPLDRPRWIGVLRSPFGDAHAVGMTHSRLAYDPGDSFKQKFFDPIPSYAVLLDPA